MQEGGYSYDDQSPSLCFLRLHFKKDEKGEAATPSGWNTSGANFIKKRSSSGEANKLTVAPAEGAGEAGGTSELGGLLRNKVPPSASLCSAVKHCPPPARGWEGGGGGRHAWNKTIQVGLSAHLHGPSTRTWRDRCLNVPQTNEQQDESQPQRGIRWHSMPQG